MNYIFNMNTNRKITKIDRILKNMGKKLSSLGVIPIIEESDSKKFQSSGNFSIRYKEGFLITGTGVDKCDLKSNSIVFVSNINHRNKTIDFNGKYKPSREVLIHDAVYSNFPEINVIVHTHDSLILKYGEKLGIPCTKNCIIAANLNESKKIVNLLKKSEVVNIKEHGQIFIGREVFKVINKIKVLNKKALVLNNKE